MADFQTGAINGSKQKLRVSDDGGVTWYYVDEEVTFSFDENSNTIPANSHDDPNNEQKLAGRSNNTASGQCQFTETSVGQAKIMTAKRSGAKLRFKAHVRDEAGAKKWTFDAAITRARHEFPDNAPASLSFDLDISGAITESTVTPDDLEVASPEMV